MSKKLKISIGLRKDGLVAILLSPELYDHLVTECKGVVADRLQDWTMEDVAEHTAVITLISEHPKHSDLINNN